MAYYILIKHLPIQSGSRLPLPDVTKANENQHNAGSLFKELESVDEIIICHKIEEKTTYENVHIPKSLLEELNTGEVGLLLAIPRPESNRLIVWQDKKWLREGITLKVDTPVSICNHKSLPRGAEGIIRYKGPLPSRQGIWFGVELSPSHAGDGTTDGIFRRQRFFECTEDCGIFVSIWCIRNNEFGGARLRSRDFTNEPEDTIESTPDIDLSAFAFKLQDRVVWMSDEGPQNGTIKWIGRLPESESRDIVVGVYFDKAVGSGTGRYKGRQLFETPVGHASLMPPLGLISFADFYGKNTPDTALEERFKALSVHKDIDDISKPLKPGLYSANPRSNQPPDLISAPLPGAAFPKREPLIVRNPLTSGSTFAHAQTPEVCPPVIQLPTLGYSFEIGSKVYTVLRDKRYGIIRYIGQHPKKPDRQIAGIEMEEPDPNCYTDGEFAGVKLFDCPHKRAFFVYLERCYPDDRDY